MCVAPCDCSYLFSFSFAGCDGTDPFTAQDMEKSKQEVPQVSSPQPASPTGSVFLVLWKWGNPLLASSWEQEEQRQDHYINYSQDSLFFLLCTHQQRFSIYLFLSLLLFFPGSDAELFGVTTDSGPFAGTDSKADFYRTDPQVKPQVNGRESASPEMFDLSRLAPPLSAPPTRVCRTPEAFLGPTGASLVNLDALIPPNPPSKTHNNPFLSGKKLVRSTDAVFTYCGVSQPTNDDNDVLPLRFECSISHQPLPLRPASSDPQPNATVLYIPASPQHAVLQPVPASPTASPATHPPFLSHTTSCWTPRPSLQPTTTPASLLSKASTPHSVADTHTQPQPIPLRLMHPSVPVCTGKGQNWLFWINLCPLQWD